MPNRKFKLFNHQKTESKINRIPFLSVLCGPLTACNFLLIAINCHFKILQNVSRVTEMRLKLQCNSHACVVCVARHNPFSGGQFLFYQLEPLNIKTRILSTLTIAEAVNAFIRSHIVLIYFLKAMKMHMCDAVRAIYFQKAPCTWQDNSYRLQVNAFIA